LSHYSQDDVSGNRLKF